MLYTVLGASGFVGRRLVAALRADGHEVYAPEREDAQLFARELGAVFYCIGLTADYARQPHATVEAHAGFLSRLLQEARFDRLVYLSSTRLYDRQPGRVGEERSDLLLNPHQPRHLYDLTKALGENLCLNYSSGRASVARLACVYDFEPDSPGFLSEWLQKLATNKDIRLESASGIVRDYIALDDVVRGLRAMIDQRAEGVVNLASGENISNLELAMLMGQHGWHIHFARTTEREQGVLCDIRRLRQLGVQPRSAKDYVVTYMEKLARCA